jgi:glycosyltransferase involved in cell wall biosynthesis
MKVVHVSPAVFGPGKRGGGERYVTELVRAQIRSGMDVSLVEIPSPWNASIVDLAHEASSRKATLRETISVLRSSDIVHVHQLNTSAFDITATARLAASFKLVLTDHGGGNLTPGRVLGAKRLSIIDGAAFVSHWSRNDVDPDGRVGDFSVIYGGGDHIVAAGPKIETRFDFGFIGRILPHKGVHIAVEALPDGAKLVVAGEARDSEYLQHLHKLAAGKQVTFLHDLSDSSMGRLYESLRYLVVPSVTEYGTKTYARPELLGLVALEALCLGTSVIGSNVGGLGEFLLNAGQRVVQPGHLDAWREVLKSAYASADDQVTKEAFTWSAVAANCHGLYSNLLSRV